MFLPSKPSTPLPRDLPDGDDYLVEVEGYEGRVKDRSDRPFTVTGKKIGVFTPRAGDRWYRTQNQMISLRATG
ncbi:MAG: hypothetical protein KJ727_03415, partial [Acidobacteria bacterium]|nr:hypothetical protein [Acidobacteriota bacterium]